MGLRDKMLSLIDSSALQAKNLVETINDTFGKINFDNHLSYLAEKRDSLIERGNSLMKDFGDLLKQVKDSFTDFSVTVPFDEEAGETLEYSVEGDKLTVEVKFQDDNTVRENKTVVTIPENCDTSKINKTLNKVTKTAVISIPKKVDNKKEETVRRPARPQRDRRNQPRGKGGRFVKKD
jgi:hypothetical protein